jgi:hypothetical protein
LDEEQFVQFEYKQYWVTGEVTEKFVGTMTDAVSVKISDPEAPISNAVKYSVHQVIRSKLQEWLTPLDKKSKVPYFYDNSKKLRCKKNDIVFIRNNSVVQWGYVAKGGEGSTRTKPKLQISYLNDEKIRNVEIKDILKYCDNIYNECECPEHVSLYTHSINVIQSHINKTKNKDEDDDMYEVVLPFSQLCL